MRRQRRNLRFRTANRSRLIRQRVLRLKEPDVFGMG